MIEEERSPACNAGGRIEDHCVDITEMVGSGIVPENLPAAQSMGKPESRRQTRRVARMNEAECEMCRCDRQDGLVSSDNATIV